VSCAALRLRLAPPPYIAAEVCPPVPRARSDASLRPRFASLPNPSPRPIIFIILALLFLQVPREKLEGFATTAASRAVPASSSPPPLICEVRVGFCSSSQLPAPRVPPLGLLQMRNLNWFHLVDCGLEAGRGHAIELCYANLRLVVASHDQGVNFFWGTFAQG
jgi:hypothetical protein